MTDFDLSFLIVIFLLYILKFFLIDTKIRHSIEYKYKKERKRNDYILKVMFKPYILYIKEKENIEPKWFWLNVCVVAWLLLSVILTIVHTYIIKFWLTAAMFWCNIILYVLIVGYVLCWSLRSMLRGDNVYCEDKKVIRNRKLAAYFILAMLIVDAVMLIVFLFRKLFC